MSGFHQMTPLARKLYLYNAYLRLWRAANPNTHLITERLRAWSMQ